MVYEYINEDCYFHREDEEMGARLHWCTDKQTFCNFRFCNDDCKNYITKGKVRNMVYKYLAERENG